MPQIFSKVSLEQWLSDTAGYLDRNIAIAAYNNITLPDQPDGRFWNIRIPYDFYSTSGGTRGQYMPIKIFTGLTATLDSDDVLQLSITPTTRIYQKYSFVSSAPVVTRAEITGKQLIVEIVSNQQKMYNIAHNYVIMQALKLDADASSGGGSSGGASSSITVSVNGGNPVHPDSSDNIDLEIDIPDPVSITINNGAAIGQDANGNINLTIDIPDEPVIKVNDVTVDRDDDGAFNIEIKNQDMEFTFGDGDPIEPDNTGKVTIPTTGIMLFKTFASIAALNTAMAAGEVSMNTMIFVTGSGWYIPMTATTYAPLPLTPITVDEINSMLNPSTESE